MLTFLHPMKNIYSSALENTETTPGFQEDIDFMPSSIDDIVDQTKLAIFDAMGCIPSEKELKKAYRYFREALKKDCFEETLRLQEHGLQIHWKQGSNEFVLISKEDAYKIAREFYALGVGWKWPNYQDLVSRGYEPHYAEDFNFNRYYNDIESNN